MKPSLVVRRFVATVGCAARRAAFESRFVLLRQAHGYPAQKRVPARAAELQSRGVPANRVVAVGRTTGYDLNSGTGIGSPNRRVEFEIGFIGEPGGR